LSVSDASTPGGTPAATVDELGELPGRMAATMRSLQAAAGVEFGCSEKDAIHREDKLTLYHYRSVAPSANLPPVLIVYALVNRPYMMDLQPDRSLIRRLLELGIDVYLIDWGYPDGARCSAEKAPDCVGDAAWRLPGRHVQPLLCGAAPGARAESHHDGDAGRFPDA